MNIKKYIGIFLVFAVFVGMGFVLKTTKKAEADGAINIWWPTNNVKVSGLQPFKAMVSGKNVNEYDMTWSVDGGQQNGMFDSYTDYPHKEASVDLTSWTWRGSGPYKITFKAVAKGGNYLGESSVDVYLPEAKEAPTTVVAGTAVQAQTQSEPSSVIISNVSPITTTNKVVTSKIVAMKSLTNTPSQPAPTPTATQTSSQTTTQPETTAPVQTAPQQEPAVQVAGNPLSGLKFFVNPYSNAKQTADAWRSSRPGDASLMDKIAQSPEAIWLGGWSGDVKNAVSTRINAAKAQGAAPVFIAYNIPGRDCGQYSAGGLSDGNAYRSWIEQIAAGINGSKAIVVLEPDALTLTDCLSQQQKNDRFAMLSDAISILKNAGAIVYLDAGHSAWIGVDEMANRLNGAGISKADGFALNTSNFQTTQSNIDYGTKISQKVGGKHFVIDTARNGAGPAPDNQWCNPPGRALGNRSTINTGNSLVDAFLWLKNPGESDGSCNGGPSAGTWWPEYALGLAQRASF